MNQVVTTLSRRLRKKIFFLHRMLGIPLGLVFALMGLSGSFLVFGDAWDRTLQPELLRVVPLAEDQVAPQALLEQVLATHPNKKIQRIRFPKNPSAAYEFCFTGKDPSCVYIDPYRNKILGERMVEQSWKRRLFLLHSHLLAGEVGATLIGILGGLLLFMSLSGLWLWWPRRRPKEAAPKLSKANSWKKTNHRLHKWVGFGACAFLLVTAATGTAMAFEKPTEKLLNWVFQSAARKKPPTLKSIAANPTTPTLQTILSSAQHALPEGEIIMVTWPKKAGDAIVVRKKMPSEFHPNGRSFVYIDAQSGQVLMTEDARHAPLGTKIRNVLYPIHTGALGGLGMQVLQLLVGLSPLVLCITGWMMWRNKKKYKKA